MAELWQTLIDNSGAVIAFFTIVLAITTMTYVVVSAKLLKQSKNAFFADMVLRMMEIYRIATKEMVEGKKGEIDSSILEGWTAGYSKAFIEVDKRLGTDLLKVFLVGMEAAQKDWREALERKKEEMKKGKEEMEKLEKELKKLREIKKAKDLEHPKND